MIKKVLTAIAVAVVGVAIQVNANLVTPDGNLYVGHNDGEALMGTLLGTPVTELWKWNKTDDVPDSATGSGFNIVWSADRLYATLSWNLTGRGIDLWGVAWKDGVLADTTISNLGFLWSAVSSDERIMNKEVITIDLAPAFKNPDAWSHIAFYGKRTPDVPDGGWTVGLLGLALAGLGMLQRKLS